MATISVQYTITILCCAVLVVIVETQHPSYDYSYNPHPEHYTRKVVLKQGSLHGVVVQRRFDDRVVSVEQYLGIPYAKPPVGDLRFMPPGSAPSWTGIKYADSFRDVCPQNLPDTTKMEHDRRQHLRRLFRHLRNESEDCLYLNIYTPSQGDDRSPRKYPVMVFVHGESFEWNSGNAYDGSLLASYGKVIVVTLNFRLGILGFLKIGPTRANFGLIDQIAALVWIKDNIEAFGGNPDAVTMFGHGTGAACISHLMLSPMIMSDGNRLLFQRAILMSGTALADWAMAGKPMEVTYNVARILNCPPSDDEQTLTRCLTKRRLQEIKEAAVSSSQFITRFGPVVDGSVIPNDPKKIMTNYHDIFSRFELMYGVTELESVHLLEAVALTHGMLERERDSQLRRYLDTRCEFKPDFCLMRTLEEYGGAGGSFDRDMQDGGGLPFHEQDRASLARDTLLEMLSDARTTAPITMMAKLHSIRNAQSYFYVFAHKTASRNLDIDKSVYGEDLPFVFGSPLDSNPNKFNPDQHFSREEKLLSKMMMTLWSNFVYSGNPNIPGNPTTIGDDHMIWYNFDMEWPEYDKHQQRYLHIDHPPALSARYREHRVRYWNEDFPKLRDIPLLTFTTKHPYRPGLNPKATTPSPVISDIFGNHMYGRPTRPTTYQEMYGHETKRGPYDARPSVSFGKVAPTPTPVKSGTSTNLIIILGVLFLLVNVALFSGLYYKCVTLKKKNAANKSSIEDQTIPENPLDKPPEPTENGCNLMKMIGTKSSKSGDTYEAVKTHQSTSSKRKLTRQFSSSTIDAHTKVRDWIAQEIVNKYSPKFLRRNRRQVSDESKQRKLKPEEFKDVAIIDNSGITASTSTLGQSPTRPVTPAEEIKDSPKLSMIPVHKKKAEKVSVAVDATPAGRGSSVMRQQPIELTKSLDYSSFDSERDPRLRRSATLDDVCSIRPQEQLSRRNSTSINLQLQQPEEATVIKIEHHHSKSDPVDTRDTGRKLKTFDPGFVNVTSRDEVDVPPLTPEESLQTIKRRNFPKVLPDLPGDTKQSLAHKRRSMPAPGYLFLPIPENPSLSQPNSPTGRIIKCPPPPPPRISTLGRNQTFQPAPKLAIEPPVPEEPEIACNNLYIGPLIPSRENRKIILKPADNYKYDNQPIYDNLNPKLIIAADKAPPIRRIEPKVIIKPTISRTISDPSKNKGPRVVMNDNLTPSSPKDKTDPLKPDFISGIPILSRENSTKSLRSEDKSENKESSSDSTPSEGSDTGTVVKNV